MDRPWDPENLYTHGTVKRYRFWTLELSFRQHTIGCFIIFCNRDARAFTEIQLDEFEELKKIMRDMEYALSQAFSPIRYNYCQMGNSVHHLHFHGFPRYDSNRTFDGKIYVDKPWGPPLWTNEFFSNDQINTLKSLLIPYLSSEKAFNP